MLLSGLDSFNITIITVSRCLKRLSVQAFIYFATVSNFKVGASVAEWLECWTNNLEAPSSGPAQSLAGDFYCSSKSSHLGFLTNLVKFDLNEIFF